MTKKPKNIIFVILLTVFVIIFVINTSSVTVDFPSAQYLDEYNEFYFYKKDIIVRPFLDIGISGHYAVAKIWFLPGQKNKLLNKIKADVNAELWQIAKENSDIIKDFKISDDFKKIHIYCYIDSTNSSRYFSLNEMLTENIVYRVELYFQILEGYEEMSFDGDILNYVEESNNYSAYNENIF